MGDGYHLSFWPVLIRWPMLLDGLWVTVVLSLVGMIAGTAIGILGGLGRRSRLRPVRWAMRAYVELFRNTPLLVQLFLFFFGLPAIGIRLSPPVAACLALMLNNGAYTTEIIRAGLAATPVGQIEAAQSLGLRQWKILTAIVLRPALERVYPALVSQNVLLMLSTSMASAIGLQELTGAAAAINSETFRSLEVFLASAALYLLLNYAQRLLLWRTARSLFPHRHAKA
jgi:polar amino acid transport system permease protein